MHVRKRNFLLFFLIGIFVFNCLSAPMIGLVVAQNNNEEDATPTLDIIFSDILTVIPETLVLSGGTSITPTGIGRFELMPNSSDVLVTASKEVTAIEKRDFGLTLVPKYEPLPNGSSVEVLTAAFVKDYEITYSLTVETKATDNYILAYETALEPILYAIYRRWALTSYDVPGLMASQTAHIPYMRYENNAMSKAQRITAGNLQLRHILDPYNAFPNFDERQAFPQTFNSTSGTYDYLQFWMGIVGAQAGGILANGTTDDHEIKFDLEDYDVIEELPYVPPNAAENVYQVGYLGVIDSGVEVWHGGNIDGLPVNTDLRPYDPVTNQIANTTKLTAAILDGTLYGQNKLEAMVDYDFEISPIVKNYWARHLVKTYTEGHVEFLGTLTSEIRIAADEKPKLNYGITVTNRWMRLVNKLTIRIACEYNFTPTFTGGQFQGDPWGETGDKIINPTGWLGAAEIAIGGLDIFDIIFWVVIIIVVIAVVVVGIYIINRLRGGEEEIPGEHT